MASVRVASSRASRPRRKTAMRKAAIWASVTSCLWGVRWTMAWMKARISASVRVRPSRLWRITSRGWMDILLRFSVLSLQVEGGGEEFGHRGLRQSVVFPGKEDGSVVGAELVDGLAAGSAGLAGSVVEVGDGD